jgi:GNAT superfamily N-acetyltransferase
MKFIFVPKVDNQIVGFAVVDEPYGGVSLLRWLGVRKEFQKHGIGSALIHNWIDLARQQHCHKAEVAAQPEAKEFYAKMGLELEGHRKKSYFGIDQYIFGKVLKP